MDDFFLDLRNLFFTRFFTTQQYPSGTQNNLVNFEDKIFVTENGKELIRNPMDFLEPGFPAIISDDPLIRYIFRSTCVF
jgi:hypothetical protein